MLRELIDTGRDKRYVRRDKQGQFKESDDAVRSLSADRRRKAKDVAKKGEGDRGDRSAAPRFRAVGEYSGRFMSGQFVLRGAFA